MKRFSDGLKGVGKERSKDFERSIGLLLHFLGFSYACPRHKSTQSVDITAFTDDHEQLILIECTIDSPDFRNMLGKFASRKRLYLAKSHKKIIAPLATSLEREDLSPVDRAAVRDRTTLESGYRGLLLS